MITPVGLLFILITILILKSRKPLLNFLIFCTITDIFFEAGYCLKTGESHLILYSDYTQKVFLLYCIFVLINKHIKLSRSFYLLNICYIIPIILLMLYPCTILIADGVDGGWDDIIHGYISATTPSFTSNVSRYTMRFFYATFIAMVVYKRIKEDDLKHYLIVLSKMNIVFIIIGFVEYFFKTIGLNKLWGEMLETMLGFTESTVYVAELRGGDLGLNLFTRESSHFAFSLLLCLIINLATNILSGRKNGLDKFTIVILLLMLLTTSFSMVMFLVGFMVIFFLYRWTVLCPATTKKEIIILMAVVFFGSSLVMTVLYANQDSFVTGRLLNLTGQLGEFFNMDADGKYRSSLGDFSAFARIYSVIMTLNAFLARPLFGISLGAAYCHGATAMLLSGIGIVGVYFLVKYYFYDTPYHRWFNIKKVSYLMGIFIYFFINMLNSLELRPFCNTTLIAVAICFSVVFSRQSPKLKNNKTSI